MAELNKRYCNNSETQDVVQKLTLLQCEHDMYVTNEDKINV